MGAGQESDPGFMRTHTKVGRNYVVEPYVDVVRKVWLLGFSPRRLIFSPFFLYASVFPDLGYLLVPSIYTSEWLGKVG